MKKQYSYPSLVNKKPVGESVLNNIGFLKALVKTKSDKKRRRLLRLATSAELLTIIEIAINILKLRFQLTTRQRTRLIPYASYIRHLARARSERGARKILQKGEGIGIASLITPVLIEALRILTSKNGS